MASRNTAQCWLWARGLAIGRLVINDQAWYCNEIKHKFPFLVPPQSWDMYSVYIYIAPGLILRSERGSEKRPSIEAVWITCPRNLAQGRQRPKSLFHRRDEIRDHEAAPRCFKTTAVFAPRRSLESLSPRVGRSHRCWLGKPCGLAQGAKIGRQVCLAASVGLMPI
jgi:hypothetical protein